MTLNNSLYIGVSGLLSHGEAISTVGDNIANVSTVGFKRARASFQDILGGETSGQRVGGGVYLGASQTLWTQGTVSQTGNALDLAVNGGGMFMVRGTHAGVDNTYYTRDGRFRLDNAGYIVNPAGLRLQGYPIDSAGNRGLTPGDLPLGARQAPPVASQRVDMILNLSANAPVPPPFDPASPHTTSSYATSVTVYDSLGASHRVEVYFRHQGGGVWEWHGLVDGAEVTGGTPGTPTQIAAGTLTFDAQGRLASETITASSASFVNAAPGQVITFDFGDDLAGGGTGLGGTTQFSGTSNVTSVDIDGHGFGNLTDLVVTQDGRIQGVFDNGDRIDLAQLAIADFASHTGLERLGDGLWGATPASGAALADVAGTGTRGTIVASALEASNVDLGNELITLIAYQRAFQANAKTVSTVDEMMADVNSLKR
jgi:flagellar hook protein FlgE